MILTQYHIDYLSAVLCVPDWLAELILKGRAKLREIGRDE